MSRHELKLLVVALAAIALLAVSLFGMPWFRVTIDARGLAASGDGAPRVLRVDYDLDSARMCPADGVCVSVALDKSLPGASDGWKGGRLDDAFTWYVWTGGIALWLGRALLVLVAVQAALRLLFQRSSGLLTLPGVVSTIGTFVGGLLAGYIFAETGSAGGHGVTVTVERTWAAGMLLGGSLLALVALTLARRSDDDVLASRRVRLPAADLRPGSRAAGALLTVPARDAAASRARRASRLPDSIPLDDPGTAGAPPASARSPSGSDTALRGKIRYAAGVIGVSRAGIDGLREDQEQRTVPWSRITAIVARRLPGSAITFVDVVSTPGATLRLMPWTQITGEEIAGAPEARARAFAGHVMARCPAAQVDPATRAFLEGERPAPQLADEATLAEHDRQVA